MESQSDNEICDNSTIEFADKPPLKTPMCYSINHVEILENSGNDNFASQFEADDFIQKVISLIKKPEPTKINRLPAPWREKFRCFSLDDKDFLYMDESLVIPKTLRPIILRSLHYGHLGSDNRLAKVVNVWWPRLHREVVGFAQTCQQCKTAVKNIQTLLRQKQVGQIPKCNEMKKRNSDRLRRPFSERNRSKKIHFVSINHYTGWPKAKFLRNQTRMR